MEILLALELARGASSAWAGGTAENGEIDAILAPQPQVAQLVRAQVEPCRASWMAAVRLDGRSPLGGKRLGPYERRFRPMGSTGSFDLVVTVKTSIRATDDRGKEVDVTEATHVEATLVGIEIREEACAHPWCMAGGGEHPRPSPAPGPPA